MKDLVEVSFVHGIDIQRDRSHHLLVLSQKAYIEHVLKKFTMQGCKSEEVPITKGNVLKE